MWENKCCVKFCRNEPAIIHTEEKKAYCDKHWEERCEDEELH